VVERDSRVQGNGAYGAVAIGEIDRIAERLAARGYGRPGRVWQEVVRDGGEKRGSRRDKPAAGGRDFPPGNITCAPGNYYYTGERFVLRATRRLRHLQEGAALALRRD